MTLMFVCLFVCFIFVFVLCFVFVIVLPTIIQPQNGNPNGQWNKTHKGSKRSQHGDTQGTQRMKVHRKI